MISIIVPIYKSQKFLNRCIDSIITQTYNELEIILVDDGSPDDSGKICDEYKKKDSRIKVIHKANGGVSSARNAGLDIASGEYVGFVDSDDYINKEMFEVLYKDLKKNDCDVAICSWYYEIDRELSQDKSMLKEYKVINNISAIEELLKDSFKGFLCNKLFKRDLFISVRLKEELTMCEDYFAVYTVLKNAKNISINPTPLYYYVQTNNSATFNENKNYNYKNHKSSDKVFKLIYKDIKHNYSHLCKLAQFAVGRNSIKTVCEISISNSIDVDLVKYHRNIIRRNILAVLTGNKSNIRIKFYGVFIAVSAYLFRLIYKNMKKFV